MNSPINISFVNTDLRERNKTECFITTGDQERSITMAAYIIIIITALTGNFLVSLIIYKNKKMRTSANYFILNMSFSDILFVLILMPRRIFELFADVRGWLVEGLAGEISCKLVYYIQDITVAVSIQSIVVLAVDRFVAVMYPIRAGAIMSRARHFIIPLTWLFGMVLHAPYFYTFKLITKSDGQTKCDYTWTPHFDHIETERIYSITIFIFLSVIPVSLITILYATIVVKLNRRKVPPGELSISKREQLRYRQRQNSKVSRMVVAVVIVFVLVWTPYNVYIFLIVFVGTASCRLTTLHLVATLIGYFYPVVNPIIYFIFSENYRRGIKNIFRRGIHDKEIYRQTGISRKTFHGRFESFNQKLSQDPNGSPRMQFYRSCNHETSSQQDTEIN